MSKHSARGRPWTRLKHQVLARSTICWLCGHPGSDSVDHVVPASLAPHLKLDPDNLRPAHHQPCPWCNQRCNSKRGNAQPKPPRTSRRW